MNILTKFFKHLSTVNKHRREVRKLCFKCGLYWQGLTHDLSKYSPVEFYNGVKYFTGTASPHIGERAEKGRSDAWLHHKGHNKHHGEYWQDIRPNGKTDVITMPPNYLAEMLCDRVAASKTYLKDKYTTNAPLDYYLSHKDENQFETSTRVMLEHFLLILANEGEKEFFSAIKRLLKEYCIVNKNK